jgi:Flp pilus assembly protein TadB
VSTRRSKRKRSRAKHRREKMRQFSRALAKGGEYSVLVLGLLGCLAGTLVTFFADDTAYAVLLLLLGLFVGAALWKREAA